jgi:hypothetical protein
VSVFQINLQINQVKHVKIVTKTVILALIKLIVTIVNLTTFMIRLVELVIVTRLHLITLGMVANLILHVNLGNGIMVLIFVIYVIPTVYFAVI